jgi:hypothetical protein
MRRLLLFWYDLYPPVVAVEGGTMTWDEAKKKNGALLDADKKTITDCRGREWGWS